MRIARARFGDVVSCGAIERDLFFPMTGNLYHDPQRVGQAIPTQLINLATPIDPNRIFVVLAGFRPHPEAALDPGAVPQVALKAPTSVSGDGGTIICPTEFADQVHVEVEMAAVVGSTLSCSSLDEARRGTLGFTIFNDVSVLDLCRELYPTGGVSLGKSFDTFASLGPWIDTDVTELEIANGLSLITRVNGEIAASGNTRLFKFTPSEVISYLSRFVTLVPGDVVSLGSPSPTAPVMPGDQVELEVEGLGILHNKVIVRAVS